MNCRFIEVFSDEIKRTEGKSRLEITVDHYFFENSCHIGKNSTISNSYIFSESEIGPKSHIEYCILGKGIQLPGKMKMINKLVLKEGIFDINP